MCRCWYGRLCKNNTLRIYRKQQDLRGDNSCSIILPTLHLYIHNEGQLFEWYTSTQISTNSNRLGKTHILKRDFLAILQGGSSSSSNEVGWDDWPTTSIVSFCSHLNNPKPRVHTLDEGLTSVHYGCFSLHNSLIRLKGCYLPLTCFICSFTLFFFLYSPPISPLFLFLYSPPIIPLCSVGYCAHCSTFILFLITSLGQGFYIFSSFIELLAHSSTWFFTMCQSTMFATFIQIIAFSSIANCSSIMSFTHYPDSHSLPLWVDSITLNFSLPNYPYTWGSDNNSLVSHFQL